MNARCGWLAVTFVLEACVSTSAPSMAAEPSAPPAARSSCVDDAYRAFDFWLGAWEVTDPAGTVQGRNRITSEEAGCLLVERWTSAKGNTGQSYNYFDPVKKTWRQVWVSSAAVIDYEGGLTPQGSMRLEGTIAYRNGTSFPFVGEWTPQPDGSVRQHFEQYNPKSQRWDPWFTGIYRRTKNE